MSYRRSGPRRSVNDLTPPSLPHPRAARRVRRRLALDIVQTILQTVLVFSLFTALVGRYEIQQTSMFPNFVAGQRVIVSRVGGTLPSWLVRSAEAAQNVDGGSRDLHRGQVVVFFRGEDQHDDPLIKRLIAVPGDTIRIANGLVYVNDTAIDEPYLRGITTDCSAVCGPLRLGPDEYFFMGDNRPVSLDSRIFGPIPGDHIVGRVVARFWPPDALAVYP